MVEAFGQAKVLPCVYHQHGQLEETLKDLDEVLTSWFGGIFLRKDLHEFSSCDVVKIARLLKHLVAEFLINIGTQAFLGVVQVPLAFMRLELDLDQPLDHALDIIGVRDAVRLEITRAERRVTPLCLLDVDCLGACPRDFVVEDGRLRALTFL